MLVTGVPHMPSRCSTAAQNTDREVNTSLTVVPECSEHALLWPYPWKTQVVRTADHHSTFADQLGTQMVNKQYLNLLPQAPACSNGSRLRPDINSKGISQHCTHSQQGTYSQLRFKCTVTTARACTANSNNIKVQEGLETN